MEYPFPSIFNGSFHVFSKDFYGCGSLGFRGKNFGASVFGMRISGYRFSGKDFRGTGFRGTRFRGNGFRGKRFRGIDFRDIGFRGKEFRVIGRSRSLGREFNEDQWESISEDYSFNSLSIARCDGECFITSVPDGSVRDSLAFLVLGLMPIAYSSGQL